MRDQFVHAWYPDSNRKDRIVVYRMIGSHKIDRSQEILHMATVWLCLMHDVIDQSSEVISNLTIDVLQTLVEHSQGLSQKDAFLDNTHHKMENLQLLSRNVQGTLASHHYVFKSVEDISTKFILVVREVTLATELIVDTHCQLIYHSLVRFSNHQNLAIVYKIFFLMDFRIAEENAHTLSSHF
jgi:uncharacterized protein YoxC